MPLARKFSSVFKKKSRQIPEEEDDYNLRLAVQASLQQQEDGNQREQIERAVSSQNGISQAMTDLEKQLRVTTPVISHLTASTNTLKAENETLRGDIRRLEEINKNHQATIKALDERLSLAEKLDGGDDSEKERVGSALLKENHDIMTNLQQQKAKFDKYRAIVESKWAELQNHKAGLETQLAIEKKEKEDTETALNVLQEHNESVSTEVEGLKRSQTHLKSLFGSGTTPRIILMLKVLGGNYHFSSPTESSARFRQTGAVQHLSAECLDLSLNASEVGNFVESLCRGPEATRFYRSLSLKLCSLCEVPKFVPSSSATAESQHINEFPRSFGQTQCCSAPICSACLLEATVNAIRYDWWHNLGSQPWIRCPITSCQHLLGIRNIGELETLLRGLGHNDLNTHLQMFERATILRSALQRLDPKPSAEALTVTSNLHKQLMQRNRMHDFFDSRFNNTIPDESGRMPMFNPGKILQAEIDAGHLTIPIFTRFFRRRITPRECSICTEVLYDLDFESDDQWMESCDGLHGPWMWNVLLFPTRLNLDCDHDIDACKACFSTHLTTQLDENGVNGCDRLSCPICNRILNHHEIQLHAAKETFQKYDKFCVLKLLSAEPGFRWCLRPGCPNGQLYDDTEYLDPHIVCGECAFESCFTHQVPWHEGLSCDQYESQREHGDPDYAQTQDWIREHSKPCPGCGANVQKDDGCFHMTCRACRHEFCWECLANWNNIHLAAGQYNASAHNEGCWFRTGNIQPTAIQGNDLQEALRQRRIT